MNQCEGCGWHLSTGQDHFGGPGQAFCVLCWFEEMELAILREPLERERGELEKELVSVEKEMDDIESPLYFAEEYGGMQITSVRMNLDHKRAGVWFRLEDVKEELACLTVQYQRQYSVIGRAAA